MLKERIEARLEALGLNQFQAVEGTQLARHFIYDILAGRKQNVRSKNLQELARALRCSVAYLEGKSDDVGLPPKQSANSSAIKPLTTAGIIDAQSWRREGADSTDVIEAPPLPQYAASRQMIFVYRGEPFQQIRDGMFVVAIDAQDFVRNHGIIGPGSNVIVQRKRRMDDEDFTQTTIRKLTTSAADRALAKRIDAAADAKSGNDEGRVIAVPVLAMQPIV